MKIHKIIILAIFFSIFLYSSPIKEVNSFDKSIVEKKIKQNKNSSIVFKKFTSDLKQELTSKQNILKDIHHKKFLRRFYRQNSYKSLWFTKNGLNQKKLSNLFKEIKNDLTLELDNKIYKRYKYISQYIKQKNIRNSHIELQLTELYFEFLNHILYGSINWQNFSRKLTQMRKKGLAGNWVRYKPQYSISELLLQSNIHDTIKEI
ncbi:MAG: hypothetical protein KAU90_09205, partial [Sulfurovaceae bacterium]|nr:hypothetical protein [Sulfurovaceae bacterium]